MIKSIGIRYIVSIIQSCDLLCWLQHGLAFNYCRRQQESHGAVFGTLTRSSTPVLGIIHDNGHFIWDSTGISIHIYISNTVYSGGYCGYLCRFHVFTAIITNFNYIISLPVIADHLKGNRIFGKIIIINWLVNSEWRIWHSEYSIRPSVA